MSGCIGFKESLVLSLKDSWTEADLRQLLIEKDQGGEGVCYHSRDCKGDGARDYKGKKVSSFCHVWFHKISSKKTKEEFFKGDSGKLQDRAENDWSEEESSCDKGFDGEANREDEQNYVVGRDDEQKVGRDKEQNVGRDDQKRDNEESKSCKEIQLGANSKSKHQAARFALNQQKT